MRKKMLISIAIISIMLLNCIAPLMKVAADTDVRIILESNLFAAVKAELQIKGINAIYNDAQRTIIINDDEIAKVTELSLSNCGLTDLTGLEIFTNLTSLDLSSNYLNKDSNLEVLNSFSLVTLDLSSNEIEDASMITGLNDIQNLNLHNQKFNIVEVIDVDTATTSNQPTTAIYPLPKILTDNVSYIKSEWLLENNYTATGMESEMASQTKDAPYIDWSSFDHQNLKVVYAQKTATAYWPLKGMVRVSIKVSDSTNTLYNSDINLYFVTVDSEERGIYLKDKNLYNAVKRQLTIGQNENPELITYKDSENARNLYKRFFNEPQVLVISIDDIINKIPSLKLDNKRISDVSGIEKFVGLETELDLSGNYIKNFDSLVELEANQEKEEGILKQRYNEQLARVKETLGQVETVRDQIKSLQDKIKEIDDNFKQKYDALQKELKKLEDQKATIEAEIDKLKEDVKPVTDELADLQKQLDEKTAEQVALNNRLQDLNKQLADLKAVDQGPRDEIAKKEQEIEETTNRIKEIEEKIKTITTQVATNEETIATYTVTISNYEARLSEINVEITEKASDVDTLAKLQEEKARLEALVEEIRNNIVALETSNATAEVEKENLNNELTTKNESLETLKVELEDLKNQLAESESAQEAEKVQAEINDIKENQLPALESSIAAIKERIENIKNSTTENTKAVEEKQKELKEVEDKIKAKIDEIDKLVQEEENGEKNNIQKQIAELRVEEARLMAILNSRMLRLYNIYNRVDRLAGYAIPEIRNLTDKEFYDLTYDQSKSLYNSQISKIQKIEEYLTPFEKNYLLKSYSIPTQNLVEVTKKVTQDDGTVVEETTIETKDIENPITKFFTELQQDEWSLSTYKYYLSKFKTDDIYLAMYTHCYLTRLFEGTSPCVADEYCDYVIKRLEIQELSTDDYEFAKDNYSYVYELYGDGDNCEGNVYYTDNFDMLFFYAERIANSGEENAYVYLPRLLSLDVSENLLEDISNLDKFTKLLRFYAGDNELVDVSNVNWSAINQHLKRLDLSLNDISDITPLEVLTNIEYLDLSKNLIEGEFTFRVENLKKLKYLDLSYNKISDIQRLINYLAYEARAAGYNGDIGRFLRDTGTLNVYFKHQQLELKVEDVLPVGDTYKVKLPKIFSQVEEIDYANTSFAIDSARGNVTSDGKDVILDTRIEGKHTSVVTIVNTKTTSSFGYGTTCDITYRVGTANMLEVTVTPEDAEIEKGKTQQFEAEVTGENVPYDKVTWSIKGNTSEETTISEEGLVTVAENETSEEIEVIATSVYDLSAEGKVTAKIIEPVEEEDPETPTDPEKPTDPETPVDPEKPTDPETPADPEKPTNPETPAEPEKPTNPETPTEPEKPANPGETTGNVENPVADIKLGYKVSNDGEQLTEIQTKTSISDFKSVLLNDEEYNVVVKSSGAEVTTGYIGTGMFVQIQNKDGEVVKGADGNLLVYEAVVKGDINGDGKADSLDSLLIKAYRNEVQQLVGTKLRAADINNDNKIDSKDSKLLLYHRAEVNGYDLNYTK